MTPDPVITLGEVMMVFSGPVTRHRVPLGSNFSCTFAGAEANVSIALARLGVPVRYLTVLGEDAFGEAITQQLLNERVDVYGIAYSKRNPTGVLFKEWYDPRTPAVMGFRSRPAIGPGTARPCPCCPAGTGGRSAAGTCSRRCYS